MKLETAFRAIELEEKRISRLMTDAGILGHYSIGASLYCSDGAVWCRLSAEQKVFADQQGRISLQAADVLHRNVEAEIAQAAENLRAKKERRK